jgi:hypothetical protein
MGSACDGVAYAATKSLIGSRGKISDFLDPYQWLSADLKQSRDR